jgi:quinol monooxygenase YgiN
MISVIWEFRVKPQHVSEFERDYCDLGSWSTLFRGSRAYHGTRLVRDREDHLRFLTLDTWDDFASYENFRAENAERYRELDGSFEKLTDSERFLGIFEVL